MRVHAISTGTVRVTERQRRGVGRGPLRPLLTMADRRWTGPLPIWAWAIEHPEGVIVVDTGETARASEPGWFPRWHPYFRLAVRVQVRPEQEIGPQLVGLGIDPAEVRRLREGEGLGPAAIARRLKIGRASVYRLLGGKGKGGDPTVVPASPSG